MILTGNVTGIYEVQDKLKPPLYRKCRAGVDSAVIYVGDVNSTDRAGKWHLYPTESGHVKQQTGMKYVQCKKQPGTENWT